MAKRKSKKQSNLTNYHLKTIGIAAVAAILIGGLVFFVLHHSNAHGNSGTQTGTNTADGSKVNLSPATPSDQSSNDSHKSDIVQRDQNLGSGNSQSNSANVVITEVTSSSVKAYVNNVFEDGGSCTATATQGSQTVTGSSTGFKNVSYTQCAPINWSSPLGSGNWTITVNYKSGTSQGSQTISRTL